MKLVQENYDKKLKEEQKQQFIQSQLKERQKKNKQKRKNDLDTNALEKIRKNLDELKEIQKDHDDIKDEIKRDHELNERLDKMGFWARLALAN